MLHCGARVAWPGRHVFFTEANTTLQHFVATDDFSAFARCRSLFRQVLRNVPYPFGPCKKSYQI